jgi:cytochrome c553
MNRMMNNTLCRILIALMVWTPFQMAQAGMIGTEQVASTAQHGDRTAVLNMLSRAEVASQLQALGIDPAQAKDRVQAMSDQEITALANRLDSMPAGASSGGAVLLIIIIAVAIWWYMGKPMP